MARTNNKGFFASTLDSLVQARTRQVNRYVNGALLMLDDETLKAHGYSRAELKRKGVAHYI